MNDLVLIAAPAAAIILLALLFGITLPRRRRARRMRAPILVAPFGFRSGEPIPPRPVQLAATPRNVARQAPTDAPSAASPPNQPTATHSAPPGARATATGTYGAPHDAGHLRLESPGGDPGSHAEPRAPNLRVHRPADGTLQFVPGRFEVLEGHDTGQEIRFVRIPGTNEVEVTFGRSTGPPYRHVQLPEPTVSRLHAKVTMEGRHWRLTNLSRTNPVIVNSRPLEGDGSSVILAEGDRVEMGEVALRFRAK